MSDYRVVWSLKDRRIELRSDKVSEIGLWIEYPNRECDLNIVLPQPVDGSLPEKDFALGELQQLHRALSHILDEATQ